MHLADLPILAIFLFVACVLGLAVFLLAVGNLFSPRRPGPVKRMPYESGMDPIHDTRRRFDVRFHLLAIAFLVFDVELLFLYPWAVVFRQEPAAAHGSVERSPAASQGSRLPGSFAQPEPPAPDGPAARGAPRRPPLVFAGGMVFIALLTLGFIHDWRKGVLSWR